MIRVNRFGIFDVAFYDTDANKILHRKSFVVGWLEIQVDLETSNRRTPPVRIMWNWQILQSRAAALHLYAVQTECIAQPRCELRENAERCSKTVCVIVTAARAKQLNARRGNSALCAWPRSNLIASRDHAGDNVDWADANAWTSYF